MVPIHQLPVELLAIIFIGSMDDLKYTPTFTWSWREDNPRIKRVATLSRVASRWWYVLQEIPALWTEVHAERGAELALRRSKQLPVNIRGSSWNVHQSRRDRSIQLVKSHSHRWRSMTWDGDESSLQTVAATTPLPILEALSLRLAPRQPLTEIAYAGTPRLRELRLDGVSIPWTPLSLPGLRLFALSNVDAGDLPAVETLLTFLASCPILQEIHFDGLGHDRDWPAVPPPQPPPLPHQLFQFPTLRTLILDTVMEVYMADLVRVIRAENLTRFALDAAMHFDEPVDEIYLRALAGDDGVESLVDTVLRNAAPREMSLEISCWAMLLDSHALDIKIQGYRWIKRVDSFLDGVRLEDTTVPLRIYLHEHDDEPPAEGYTIDLGFLERLPSTVSIAVSNTCDVAPVLDYLGTPFEEGDWSCPNLKAIYLTAPDMADHDQHFRDSVQALYEFFLRREGVEVFDHNRTLYCAGIKSFMGRDMPT